MAIVYKTCTTGEVPGYMCEPCDVTEKGRVRGTFFIDKSLLGSLETVVSPATTKNIETKSWWETQIEAGLIIVVPNTRGTYDGGVANKVTGFGDKKEVVASKTHTVNYSDKNHKDNEPFYAALEESAENYVFGWRTDTQLRVARTVLNSFEAKDPVEEDTESILVWQGTAVWIQSDKKTVPIYNLGSVKDVFNCIEPGD